MTAIVFSKDRALQIDAFLRSFERFVEPRPPVTVIWTWTPALYDRHLRSYQEVSAHHPWATWHCQKFGRFKSDVLACLPADGSVVFFVDDLVFVRPWVVNDTPGLSLRLGLHLTHCYTMHRAQPLPNRFRNAAFVSWRWRDGDGDWGYPLSLDGHTFDVAELRPMIEAIDFTSPNTLEAALQVFAPDFANRFGWCYDQAKIVNIPWNRVQSDCDNRFSRDSQATPEQMLSFWEQGQQIDLRPIAGVLNTSCHQEFPLMLEPRP